MQIVKKLTPLTVGGKQCRPDRDMTPTSVTIHNTGNDTANALQHVNAQSRGELAAMQMAVHYYVDDTDTVYQCLLDTQQGWHAGDATAANGTSPNTQGGNYTSISIEICQHKGINQLQAFRNAAWLVSELLGKYGWGTDRVRQHNDWKSTKYPTGKDCPYLLRHKTDGVDWQSFLALVKDGQTTTNTPPAVGSTRYYAVQVGAYTALQNAEGTLAKLQANGHEGYIVTKDVNAAGIVQAFFDGIV